MGHTTTFDGGFTFNKPVTAKLQEKINNFSKERHPPGNDGMPGYWCQWIIDIDYNGEVLIWDGNEKFYSYVEWLEYLIKNFFEPEGYVLDGQVEFQGEDYEDFGVIEVKDNIITQKYGIHSYDLSDVDDEILVSELKRRGYTIMV